VSEVKATKGENSSSLELELPKNLPQEIKAKIKNDVGEYLVEQILSDVSDSTSPVTGKEFKELSSEYKKVKKASGAGTSANLELSGSMLSALDFRVTSDGIKLGVFGKEALKADGHNNLSGDSTLPQRRFLPDEGQSFREEIRDGVEAIVAEAVASEASVPIKDLMEVENATQLYEVLSDTFKGLSRAEIKTAVLLNDDWHDALDELDLLEWL
jgi:hypothetical protein